MNFIIKYVLHKDYLVIIDLQLYEDFTLMVLLKIYYELIITNKWANLLSNRLVNGLVNLK